MNNPRLQGVVNIFGDRYSISENSTKYEYFTNYLFIKKIYHDINKEYPFESEPATVIHEMWAKYKTI